ncbi:hypothetical protein QJS04_geneDACA013557 [Acorus gramineus]|uniref:Uncharacterized protein n=1 Tax=Acorus gramineus TaxID=55184 RepID=A0AAV9AGH7_ACOGR|nr:hypothetical protein QJS04_geneDACA013557 [Acorus gramineus]
MDLLWTTVPIDALLFNRLVSLTAVSRLWAWVAVLTAAFGFWRRMKTVHSIPIRKSDAPRRSSGFPSPDDEAMVVSDRLRAVDDDDVALAASSEPAPNRHLEECEGSTKGKFVAYYRCEDEEVEADCWEADWGSDGGDLFWRGRDEFGAVGWSGWRGDLGWYGYQDLTALNGSVVQLWDAVKSRR